MGPLREIFPPRARNSSTVFLGLTPIEELAEFFSLLEDAWGLEPWTLPTPEILSLRTFADLRRELLRMKGMLPWDLRAPLGEGGAS